MSGNPAKNQPTQRLTELHTLHKALCFKDTYSSIHEATVEYAAKYWMLRGQYDRDADIHDTIEARHMFIFPDALYHLRVVEAEKGRRNILRPHSYFNVTKLKDLGSEEFAKNAREFLESRYEARENIQRVLDGFKGVEILSSNESTEEWITHTTRPVLTVFHHDFGRRESKTSLYHGIKNYAMYAIAHPDKCDALEANMQAATQRFLERIPHLQDIQSFIRRINAQSRNEPGVIGVRDGNVYSMLGRNGNDPA